MPNTKSAEKRLKQAETRNLRNRMVKSEIKTYTRRFLAAVEAGNTTEAQELLRQTHAKLDKAVQKGVLHRNTVDRRKSLLHRKAASLREA